MSGQMKRGQGQEETRLSHSSHSISTSECLKERLGEFPLKKIKTNNG